MEKTNIKYNVLTQTATIDLDMTKEDFEDVKKHFGLEESDSGSIKG